MIPAEWNALSYAPTVLGVIADTQAVGARGYFAEGFRPR